MAKDAVVEGASYEAAVEDSDMQGVLKALGKVSYCLWPRKMLDDCVKGKVVIV